MIHFNAHVCAFPFTGFQHFSLLGSESLDSDLYKRACMTVGECVNVCAVCGNFYRITTTNWSMHSKAICQHSNTLHAILIYSSIRYTYHRRKQGDCTHTHTQQGDCTHTHTQQLPSVLVTFFEVPWSDPTDICPEVSHSFPRPNKLV